MGKTWQIEHPTPGVLIHGLMQQQDHGEIGKLSRVRALGQGLQQKDGIRAAVSGPIPN